jgi:formate dehydrogenase
MVSSIRAVEPSLAKDAVNGMTPHICDSSLSAQACYAAGTLEILQRYFDRTPIREEYLIVDSGLAGRGAKSYKLT